MWGNAESTCKVFMISSSPAPSPAQSTGTPWWSEQKRDKVVMTGAPDTLPGQVHLYFIIPIVLHPLHHRSRVQQDDLTEKRQFNNNGAINKLKLTSGIWDPVGFHWKVPGTPILYYSLCPPPSPSQSKITPWWSDRKETILKWQEPSLPCWVNLGQCCGSGYGIRDPLPFWPLDPGSGIGFFRILDPKPIFWELIDNFLGKKFYT